jgi:hypothetical protein
MESYEMKDLVKIFTDHAQKSQESEIFKNTDFNLPKALMTICQEIADLRYELNSLSDQYYGYYP